MARYTGPTTRIARKFGEAIFGYDKHFEKRKYPPGQHGPSKRRKQSTEYSTQLMEKQKVKYTYGVLERQFRNLFKKASRKQGMTGENLLKLLESRLDNVVFRLGLAPTRRAARQLVSHRHITVNGKIVNVPSCQIKPGDRISVKEKSRSMEAITTSLNQKGKQFSWLDWNDDAMEGTFINMPDRESIPEKINEQLIVELYSK